jgi:hypothetical protein
MTTRRTYQCNLCGTPIGITPESTAGRGVYFDSGIKPAVWFKFVPTQQAEHHLCERCVEATVAGANPPATLPPEQKEKS